MHVFNYSYVNSNVHVPIYLEFTLDAILWLKDDIGITPYRGTVIELGVWSSLELRTAFRVRLYNRLVLARRSDYVPGCVLVHCEHTPASISCIRIYTSTCV